MKNTSLITFLVSIIVILVGIIIATNYPMFSEGQLIGIGIIIVAVLICVIVGYRKVKNRS